MVNSVGLVGLAVILRLTPAVIGLMGYGASMFSLLHLQAEPPA